ncbi:MAG TPA: hypothetical protein VFF68_12015, partial [Anaerolineaceae bacterium]|nr:hypothetical protein [Anaerolineaceae bacterium]
MTQSASRQSFYEHWAEQRQPWQDEIVAASTDVPQPSKLRVLVLLHRMQLEALIDEGPESVPHLVAACAGPDMRIADSAARALRLLRQPAALDSLCQQWVDERSPLLEEIITQKGILAGQPPEVRLRTALLIGRVDLAQRILPQHLEGLLSAAADEDERIASRAMGALAALTQAETREALCRRVIDQDDPRARQAALQAGCLPEETDRRALFLLLTGQWDAYAALDFDLRIMRTVYSTAPPALRKRIAAAVQAAGRIDFLPILTGAHERSRRMDWSEEEIRLLVTMLTREQAWDRLWKLAFDLPLAWSIEAARTLTQAGWQPEETDSTIYARVCELAASLPAQDPTAARFHLPAAVRAETLRVSGRVNDLAFSPAAPLLAIGTGQRSVVLWNFQKGEVETVLRGFEHSIGRVTFNAAGVLFIAERSSPDGPCDLSLWEGGEIIRLGRHERSITDICPLGDDRLLSAGNDRRIILWDLTSRRQSTWATLPYNAPRARRLMVSLDRQRVYTVHERISFFALPELNRYQEFYALRPADLAVQRSTGRCAVILPPEGDIAVGQHNGQLVCYRSVPEKTYRVRQLLAAHDRQVQDVRWLQGRSLVVSAGGEGDVRFTRWPGGDPAETLQTGMDWLTTLDVSADERFMATGSSDSSIALWDLRTDRLAAVMRAPLGSAQPADLTLLHAILA